MTFLILECSGIANFTSNHCVLSLTHYLLYNNVSIFITFPSKRPRLLHIPSSVRSRDDSLRPDSLPVVDLAQAGHHVQEDRGQVGPRAPLAGPVAVG